MLNAVTGINNIVRSLGGGKKSKQVTKQRKRVQEQFHSRENDALHVTL